MSADPTCDRERRGRIAALLLLTSLVAPPAPARADDEPRADAALTAGTGADRRDDEDATTETLERWDDDDREERAEQRRERREERRLDKRVEEQLGGDREKSLDEQHDDSAGE